MIIYVDNRPAVLKAGSSFEYISENRLFLGRDGYTLALTFPLIDCPQNREIFGYIERMDVTKSKLLYECSITDKDVSLYGTLQVTGIDNTGVKAQFSEGRCEQTVNSALDDIYINQIDLGEWPTVNPSDITPAHAVLGYSNAYAYPWVNTSYPEVINNLILPAENINNCKWGPETTQLSWMPSLYMIITRICNAIGYTADLAELSEPPFRFLMICNTMPASWDIRQYARALPAWTVAEFFEKLELFLCGEFDFDHRAKTVSFSFSRTAVSKLQEVKISEVVESYESEISKEKNASCDYIATKALAYKDTGHQLSNYYSCDWLFKSWPESGIIRYDTLKELMEYNPAPGYKETGRPIPTNLYGIPKTGTSGRPGVNGSNTGYPAFCLLYAKDVDTYFVYRSIGLKDYKAPDAFMPKMRQEYVLEPVNVFGSWRTDTEDVEDIEFIPPCIDHTEDQYGYAMFLSPSEYEESIPEDDIDQTSVGQLRVAKAIENGEKGTVTAYYDSIYIAFARADLSLRPYPNIPCPAIDYVAANKKQVVATTESISLRRKGNFTLSPQLPMVDPRQKFKFSFLSDTIPNPRSIFNIAGHRYVCEKITATFTEDGMSQLLKGEFYPLLDD